MREEEMLMKEELFLRSQEKRGKLEASGRWGVHLGIAKDHKGWLLWELTTQKLTVSRDVKFLESLYYKEWKQQQQKLPSTPLIVEADEVQQPSRQVEVAVSEEEMSGEKDEILMLLVYVDDILLFSASTALLDSAEQMLEMQFKCSKMVKADGTSIGGYVCLLGGGAVSWRSKKQNEMGLSSCICDDRS
ncbi:hypothetical protein CLOP_g732 [Closterium sp. NIES-67]|nr:hypothetical protein CLOP_g732 [Closterium sp. NIES-67]